MKLSDKELAEVVFLNLYVEPSKEEVDILEKFKSISQQNKQKIDELTIESNLQLKVDTFEMCESEKKNKFKEVEAQLTFKNEKSKIEFKTFFYAASVILLITFSTLLYYRKTAPGTDNENKYSAQNPSPGASKAILTLSNGKKFNLSDAKNGQLIEQDNLSIQKTQDGEVVFILADKDNRNLPATEQFSELSLNNITTPLGGQYQIILPDGSKVWLNSGSSLYFPTRFQKNKREVSLTGEGYFEIANNSNSSFNVFAGNVAIQVLGTKFNVKAYKEEDKATATLVQGAVKISIQDPVLPQGSKSFSLNNYNNDSVVLKQCDQSIIAKDGKFTVKRNVDTYASVAWMRGIFYFKQASIQEVMLQLARWYKLQVEYRGEIPNISFSGEMLKSAPLPDILEILKESKVNLSISGNKIIVTK